MFASFWLRLRGIFLRKQLDKDLDDELAFHLSMREQSHAGDGLPLSDARPQSRRDFGNAARIRENTRELWTFPSIESFWADLRYAVRALRANPGLCAVAVVSLTLGIGANLAIFSILNVALLRPLPVRDPQRLVVLDPVQAKGTTAWSYPTYLDFSKRQASFESVAAVSGIEPVVTIRHSPVGPARAALVSGTYFPMLGISARYGRTFSAEDDNPGDPRAVVVLSHRFWQRHFAASASAVGQQIEIHKLPFTVIGVAPEAFTGDPLVDRPDFWLPMTMQPDVRPGRNLLATRNSRWLAVLGRIRDGVSPEAALAGSQLLHQALLKEEGTPPGIAAQTTIVFEPGGRGIAGLRRSAGLPLKVLLGMTLLVLLIACANIANLLLARGASRQLESSVRLALGSGRMRLLRQFLLESLLLAVAGCALGLAIAPVLARGIVQLSAMNSRLEIEPHFDALVLGFGIALALVSATLFGGIPALRFSKASVQPALQSGARNLTPGRARQRLSRSLVAAQVSLALLLLIGSGLLVRSLLHLTQQDFGFDRRNMITVRVEAGSAGFREPAQFTTLSRDLSARLTTVPGVESVAFALCGTMGISGCSRTSDVVLEGYQARAGEDVEVGVNHVSPGYIETLRMTLTSGRSFTAADHEKAPKAAVINQALARRYFGSADPVGRRFWFDTKTKQDPVFVIGVVKDFKRAQPREEVEPVVLLSMTQFPDRFRHVELRTSVPPRQLLAAVGSAIASVNPQLQMIGPLTMDQALERHLAAELLLARLCSMFGGLALALACLGVYGVLSYSVVRRTSEIGIRMALGAKRGDVLGLVWREAAQVVAIGAIVGLAAAFASARLLQVFLFGITPRDTVSFALSTLVLLAVTMLAAYLPARRASSLDPIRALRYE